jgi:preprotein translocase subunit SecA
MYLQMVPSVKSSVTLGMFTVERAGEEELRQLEEQRRQATEKRQRQIRTSHQARGEQGGGGAQQSGPSRQARRAAARRGRRAGGPGAEAALAQQGPAQAATVKRDRPKLGRNDPCYCGSGKKYKNCHYREDQAAASPQ